MDSTAPLNGDPRATAIGFVSVFIWGSAALTIHVTRDLPAFQVLALAFALGGGALTLWGRLTSGSFAFLRQPWHYYAIVITLLFVNNAAFILGLRLAPIVTANLINYLWPLLIVLLSVPVLGRPLRWWHLLGALLGFGGCALLMTGGQLSGVVQGISADHAAGYLCAFAAALTWAVYSLLLRRNYAGISTQALGVVFLAVAGLSTATLALAPAWPDVLGAAWRWPVGSELAAVAMIGFGTLGLAYACWDYGARRGDVRVMGVGSYLTPLLSTVALAVVGKVAVSGAAWLACGLIIAGALVGSGREILLRRSGRMAGT